MAKKQRFRIFIGSPGDVAPERTVTEQVIQQLQAEYGGWVDLEWDRYENKALPANEPPQRNISDPATFDVAVFLFWHSIGSQRLPDEFRLADGTTAASGTLWEFDRAYFGVEQDGVVRRPFVLAYKKDDPLLVGSVEELERAQRGFRDIDAFAKRYIHDGTFHGYWTRYGGNELKEFLERHLREWLSKRIPDVVAAIPEIPAWTLGKSPFPGLASFTDEYASQFYGREQEIVDVCNRVEEAERSEKFPFLIVTGSSGVGKSSLLKAGVVPEMRRRALAKGSMFRRVVFRPSESSAGALHSLAEALLSDDGMKELRLFCPDGSAEFADQLRRNPDLAADRIGQAIRAIRPIPDGARLVDDPDKECIGNVNTLREAGQQFVLVVDQFEELFTDIQGKGESIDDHRADSDELGNAAAFGSALIMLSSRFGFVVLGSLRNDFLTNLSAMQELKPVAMNGLIAIGPVSGALLHKIIENPVRAAGLDFQYVEGENRSLADIICDEATQLGPHGLPMLQFVMQSLFERARLIDGKQRVLMYRDYKELGRVKGVLRQTASAVYSSLSYTDREEAKRLFLDLVSMGTAASAKSAARMREFDLTRRSAAFIHCMERFVKARLLVMSQSGRADTIRLSIAHETLLDEWADLEDWIQENKEKVVLDTLVEDQASRWNDRGRKSDYLILSNDELRAAEDLVRIEKPVKKGSVVDLYVSACTRKTKWRRLITVSVLFLFCAWGLRYSLLDIRFQDFDETTELLQGASIFIPYVFVRLVEKWLAMTNAAQRQWRSLYWACVFFAVYYFWARHQVYDLEGVGYVVMAFWLAWTWLFPAIYHLVVAGYGPLTQSAHRRRRKNWWRFYLPVPVVALALTRLAVLVPHSLIRAAIELMVAAVAFLLVLQLPKCWRWVMAHSMVKSLLNAIRNVFDLVSSGIGKIWRTLGIGLNWLTPPAAILYGFFLAGPTVWEVFDQDQQRVQIAAMPVAATFFLPPIARFSADDSRDSRVWWRAVMDRSLNTIVGMTAAPSDGDCDSRGHPDALWGHLRRLGVTEGGLAIRGGCKVGRTFKGDRLIDELVYQDIEKPLMQRIARDGGFDVHLANDGGSLSRHGRLVQLADEGGEVRWLYTTVVGSKPSAQASPAELPEPVGDRRLWLYSSLADRFRVMRVDEAMRPKRFDGEEYSTLEIGRDKAGQLATLRYLDSSGDAVADASGTHRIEFSYGSRGQCKMAIAFRVDGSELSRKPCRDTRFELVED